MYITKRCCIESIPFHLHPGPNVINHFIISIKSGWVAMVQGNVFLSYALPRQQTPGKFFLHASLINFK